MKKEDNISIRNSYEQKYVNVFTEYSLTFGFKEVLWTRKSKSFGAECCSYGWTYPSQPKLIKLNIVNLTDCFTNPLYPTETPEQVDILIDKLLAEQIRSDIKWSIKRAGNMKKYKKFTNHCLILDSLSNDLILQLTSDDNELVLLAYKSILVKSNVNTVQTSAVFKQTETMYEGFTTEQIEQYLEMKRTKTVPNKFNSAEEQLYYLQIDIEAKKYEKSIKIIENKQKNNMQKLNLVSPENKAKYGVIPQDLIDEATQRLENCSDYELFSKIAKLRYLLNGIHSDIVTYTRKDAIIMICRFKLLLDIKKGIKI